MGKIKGHVFENISSKQTILEEEYSLQMDETKELRKHIDKFNKVIHDLKNIYIRIEEDDQVILLLNSLPKMYEHFVDTLLYGKHTLTMSKVKTSLNSKELSIRSKNKEVVNGKSLIARGRTKKEDLRNNRGKSHSKAKVGKKYFYCHNGGHYKK